MIVKHTYSFTWRSYAAFHGMARTCLNEGSTITSADVSKFKFSHFHVKIMNYAPDGARGRGRLLAISGTVHETCSLQHF
jgi:hypothetical protein